MDSLAAESVPPPRGAANRTGGAPTSRGAVGGSGLVSIAAVAVLEASNASALLLTDMTAVGRRRRA
jgi:hypothetical protein